MKIGLCLSRVSTVQVALTRCFNQLPATNFTKGNKALTCWVHDVLMHRSGTKVNTSKKNSSWHNIYYRLPSSQFRKSTIVLFQNIRGHDGDDILKIAFGTTLPFQKDAIEISSRHAGRTLTTIRLFPATNLVDI